ncbi:CFI-box-CTERM domain-containing protein [Flavobacterium caeni]|uniref:Leucine rich repeat-containing protein n=1 Tax=Flavobacterium caeni TaxID=490189 RepID=A0A1G5KE51_9FLAO|nr:CFI-box-CTERM domain-containing protein [Flavobacterium caeni]SCY98837.1 hypothetical protein SAMN02927903_03258 [Flavobacterium caeni]
MSDVIQCSSCGSSNQLPTGRNSMFCAYCGNTIERKEEKTNQKSFPKISRTQKKEIPFKETAWYKDKSLEHKARTGLASSSFYNMIKNIEHYRTNNGYNVVITYEQKDVLSSFPREHKETEFVPFEYDYDSYKSELNLDSTQIQSFKELLQHYDLTEIEELKDLSLNYNNIINWDGIENFKRLERLSLRNNYIVDFPTYLPKEITAYDSNIAVIKFLDLRGNKIKTIGPCVPIFHNAEILLADNPLELESIPKVVRSCHTFKDDGREVCWDFEMKIEDDFKLKFPKKEPEKPTQPSEEQTEKPQGKCFIATATMGSYDHPFVLELRHFRDNWILKKTWGDWFIKNYYYYGEKMAKQVEHNVILKTISYHFIVKPLVLISKILK